MNSLSASTKSTSTTNSIKRYPCVYCKISNQVSFSSSFVLNIHYIKYHCEHFFPNARNEVAGVTPAMFQRICAVILFPHYVKAGRCKCAYCPQQFSWDKGGNVNLKYHLVTRHNSELREHLERILKDPKLNETLQRCNPEGVECPCGVYLCSNQVISAHKKICKKTKSIGGLIKKKKDLLRNMRSSTLLPCDLCQRLMRPEDMMRHKTSYCKNRVQKQTSPVKIDDMEEDDLLPHPTTDPLECEDKMNHSVQASSSHRNASDSDVVTIAFDPNEFLGINNNMKSELVCKDCGQTFLHKNLFIAHKMKHLHEKNQNVSK